MVEEIKSYIDENYAGDISLNVFALKYHMTKEYLSKQFKKSYGCGIYEYVLKTRMQAAVHLLADAQVKVQDISECVGYSDTNYFSRAFKSFYGVSPQKYREEHCAGARPAAIKPNRSGRNGKRSCRLFLSAKLCSIPRKTTPRPLWILCEKQAARPLKRKIHRNILKWGHELFIFFYANCTEKSIIKEFHSSIIKP